MVSTRNLNDIPRKYHSIFLPIEQFNHAQCEVFHEVFQTKNHVVVSAPTGSGKTILFELAIVELLIGLDQTKRDVKCVKIIYIAPTKALCNEVFEKWQQKFKAFALNVALLTGDADPTEFSELGDLLSYQIVVTTPEKWDAITRRWQDHADVAHCVELVLIDEVHLVGDPNRGPTLEAIVARFKSIRPHTNGKCRMRFIAVSASLPNIQDVARWVGSDISYNSVRTFQIDESKRPVKLQRIVKGYANYVNSYQFTQKLTFELPNLVQEILRELKYEQHILIFCQSRPDVENSLGSLLRGVKFQWHDKRYFLEQASKSIKDEKLKEALKSGLAFHHAGLSFEDREQVEKAFKSGLVKILLSTSTLAMGVNLPAHTVIIKSTENFTDGKTQELPESMVLQMMGRAGRQPYDSTARVYIMTKQEKVAFYENLAAGTFQIESHFTNKLAEFLNVEIGLNTVSNCDASLMRWIKTTFLYARTVKSMSTNDAVAHLKGLCQRAIYELENWNLIEIKPNENLSILAFGAIMAKYFLSIDTMKAFKGFAGNETIEQILIKIIHCNELSDIYLRRSDKAVLNSIVADSRIRFWVANKIDSKQEKVFCLLQAVLGHIPIQNSSLTLDAQKVIQTIERMANSLIEYFQSSQFVKNSYGAILSAITLAKSLRTTTWSDLDAFGALNISREDADKLIQSGINSITHLLNTNAREIEDILGKDIPYGTELISEAHRLFPNYSVSVRNGSVIVRHVNDQYDNTQSTGLTLLIGQMDYDGSYKLTFCEDIQGQIDEYGYFEMKLPLNADSFKIHVIHHSLVGADIIVNHGVQRADQKQQQQQVTRKTCVSSKKLNSKTSNGQATLDTFFPKNRKINTVQMPSMKKSISDAKIHTVSRNVPSISQRVTPNPSSFLSPDILSTPTQVTVRPPENLYDFDYAPNSCRALFKNHTESNGNVVFESPFSAETQIRHKIKNRQNSSCDFVPAKFIFSNGGMDTKKGTDSGNDDCELDDNFVDMINEELNQLNNKEESRGFEKKSPQFTNDLEKMFNLRVESSAVQAVRNDFDDSDTDDETPEPPSDNFRAFFTIDEERCIQPNSMSKDTKAEPSNEIGPTSNSLTVVKSPKSKNVNPINRFMTKPQSIFSTNMQSKSDFMKINPGTQSKRQKLDELFAKSAAKNVYAERMNTFKHTEKPQIGKMSLRHIFAQLPVKEPIKQEVDAKKELEKCEERRKNDANYKQQDYERDRIWYGVLKMPYGRTKR